MPRRNRSTVCNGAEAATHRKQEARKGGGRPDKKSDGKRKKINTTNRNQKRHKHAWKWLQVFNGSTKNLQHHHQLIGSNKFRQHSLPQQSISTAASYSPQWTPNLTGSLSSAESSSSVDAHQRIEKTNNCFFRRHRKNLHPILAQQYQALHEGGLAVKKCLETLLEGIEELQADSNVRMDWSPSSGTVIYVPVPVSSVDAGLHSTASATSSDLYPSRLVTRPVLERSNHSIFDQFCPGGGYGTKTAQMNERSMSNDSFMINGAMMGLHRPETSRESNLGQHELEPAMTNASLNTPPDTPPRQM